jgi:hypothetical protein
MHYPGSNFTGPGTKITTSVVTGIQPTSYVDAIARQHDIDYLISNGSAIGALHDDVKAILNSYLSLTPEAFAMRFGLGVRTALNLLSLGYFGNYNTNILGLSQNETKLVGQYLKASTNGATGQW